MGHRALITRIVTFLGGIYFFLEFVLPGEIGGIRFDSFNDQITNGFVCVGSMAIGLGLINLLLSHGQRIVFWRKGWFNSAALLLGLVIMALAASFDWSGKAAVARESSSWFVLRDFALVIADADTGTGKPGALPVTQRNQSLKLAAEAKLNELQQEISKPDPLEQELTAPEAARYKNASLELQDRIQKARDAAAALTVSSEAPSEANRTLADSLGAIGMLRSEMLTAKLTHSLAGNVYHLLYDGLFVSLGSAMFALLGFYIASAAYRAFRIRSVESGLMLGAAILVMLGQIPFGVWIWGDLPSVRLWILAVPNSAAFRAIAIGASLAGLIMAFRMWFSIESRSFGGGEK